MESGNHFFKLYFQRLLSSTMGWKDDAFGGYMRLLIFQFENGELPDDDEFLARISTSFMENRTVLKKKFQKKPNGFLQNPFMESVRDEALTKQLKNKENGKKGGRPKKPNGYSGENPKETYTNGYGIIDNSSLGERGGAGGERGADPGEIPHYHPAIPITAEMIRIWLQHHPRYPSSAEVDTPAVYSIGGFIAEQLKCVWPVHDDKTYKRITTTWSKIAAWIPSDDFYKTFPLDSISKTSNLQRIWAKMVAEKNTAPVVSITKKPIKPLPKDQVQYVCMPCGLDFIPEDQKIAAEARARLNAHGIGHCGLCGHEKEISHIRNFNYLQHPSKAAQS